METRLHPEIAETEEGRIAEEILRSCVHCGFCTATCPTYRLLGDELDGPRGRIYLIKQALESNRAPAGLWLHLERCLLCRACETACPSGVEYSRLLEIGREFAWHKAPPPPGRRLLRKSLTATLPHPSRLRPLLGLVRIARPLLPAPLRRLVPDRKAGSPRPPAQTERRVLLFRGCVQPVVRPGINDAAARLLHRLGIGAEEVEGERCCGAIHHHLQEEGEGAGTSTRQPGAVAAAAGVRGRGPALHRQRMRPGGKGVPPALSGRRKAQRLEEAGSRRVVTANIGCLLHLEQHGSLPVEHWVELLERCSR